MNALLTTISVFLLFLVNIVCGYIFYIGIVENVILISIMALLVGVILTLVIVALMKS